ncbi:MAG: GNAT family N-acetyltransferase [Synergistaceae bacterium]|nr:GNAT family N-acetyltransferase [Synergistaceae bacterium]
MMELDAAVWRELGVFLSRLKGLSPCLSRDLGGGRGMCLSTGSSSASENWAFYPSRIEDVATVEDAMRFFGERGEPFVWPLYHDDADQADLLRRAGLRLGGRLLAMGRSVRGGPCPRDDGGADGPAFHAARDLDGAARWAAAAWRGFDGEGEMPASSRDLAMAMAREPGLVMETASLRGEDAGTFLLDIAPGGDAGAYYVAVLPAWRRRGVARAMMARMARLADERGARRLLLQSTPSGVPFYRSVGFEASSEIPLFSTSDDVF